MCNVICRQLGLPAPGRWVGSGAFGAGSGQVLLDDISCPDSAQTLADCEYYLGSNIKCGDGHAKNVGLICNAPPSKFDLLLFDTFLGQQGS